MRIAVFDFDGTVTTKDTLLEFIKFVRGPVSFYAGFLRYAPQLLAYKSGLYPNWKVKQQIFSHFFKGMRLEDFNRLCEEFFQKEGKALVRQSARIAIWEQLQKCNRVFIVSASIYNWIKPFASDLGIRDILSTEIEVDGEGCLTGFFSNKNCYGQEKVVRLLEQIPDLENNYLIVYGDSKGDSKLLKYANESHYRAL